MEEPSNDDDYVSSSEESSESAEYGDGYDYGARTKVENLRRKRDINSNDVDSEQSGLNEPGNNNTILSFVCPKRK